MGVSERPRPHGSRAVVAQGDVWLMETPNGKRRPVLVVTRDLVSPYATGHREPLWIWLIALLRPLFQQRQRRLPLPSNNSFSRA